MGAQAMRYRAWIAGIAAVLRAGTGPGPRAGQGGPGGADPTAAEIARLAETSPHLLADIGFRPCPFGSRPGHTVWRRGALRVTLPAAAPGGQTGEGR